MAPYQKTNASRRLLKRISLEEKTHSIKVVGLGRLELPTSRLSSARSNQLSYKPVPGISRQKSAIGKDYRFLITDL